jgi:hypothetical protein
VLKGGEYMTFNNKTDRSVFLCIGQDRMELKPEECVSVPWSETVLITLSHDYGSTAMQPHEITNSDVNDDDLLWLVGENKKAVFNVALNSTYELRVSEETDIEIQRECIRPIYTCSYDRLYPAVSDGVCREVSCCFPERMRFEKVYRATREKYYKQILNVLTIPCVLLGVFITILPFLTGTTAGRIGGVVFGILSAIAIFLLRLIGSGIVKYLCKLDCKTTFSQFESQKILSYFKQEKDL